MFRKSVQKNSTNLIGSMLRYLDILSHSPPFYSWTRGLQVHLSFTSTKGSNWCWPLHWLYSLAAVRGETKEQNVLLTCRMKLCVCVVLAAWYSRTCIHFVPVCVSLKQEQKCGGLRIRGENFPCLNLAYCSIDAFCEAQVGNSSIRWNGKRRPLFTEISL